MRVLCGRSLSSKPPPKPSPALSAAPRSPQALTAAASLRQLLDSLSREQRRTQEILASLAFALRSFTHLGRFLELVPLVACRLVEAEGCLLVVFHPDGRLWTVEDSVLVIREEWPGKRPGYSVTLLGPTSAFTIQIGKGRSLAFINLWQRWTTPVPRIDLFTARDGDNDRPRGIVLGGLRRMLKFYRHKKLG